MELSREIKHSRIDLEQRFIYKFNTESRINNHMNKRGNVAINQTKRFSVVKC